MGMPVPASLRQEITAAHRHRIASHNGPNAFALDDEAKCVLGVTVLWRILPGHQVLDGRPQCGAHKWSTA
jgi:hypothetical protein